MWRQRAATRASIAVAVILVAICVVWAVLAQSLTTPACDANPTPHNAGPLKCAGDSSAHVRR